MSKQKNWDELWHCPKCDKDVTGYPALFVELAERGYSQEDLEKISMRNMMRALRGAEQFAANSTSIPPFEYEAGGSRDAE